MGFFMLGAPTETIKEINSTIAFSNTLGLDEASFSLVTPLAGTYLNDMASNGSDAMYKIYERLNYYSRYSIKGGLRNF